MTPKPPHICSIYHLIQKRCIGVLFHVHSGSHVVSTHVHRVKVTLYDLVHVGSR